MFIKCTVLLEYLIQCLGLKYNQSSGKTDTFFEGDIDTTGKFWITEYKYIKERNHHVYFFSSGQHGHHIGHSGMVHRHDFHPGGVHHGGGSNHHGYGKNIVPGQDGDATASSSSLGLDISKLVPSDEVMGLKKPEVLDFVAESASFASQQQNNNKNKNKNISPASDAMAIVEPKSTGRNTLEGFFKSSQFSSPSITRPIASFTPDAASLIRRSYIGRKQRIASSATRRAHGNKAGDAAKITDFLSPSSEPELADRRSFGHKPASFKGSILGQYKKHWDEEDDEEEDDDGGKQKGV